MALSAIRRLTGVSEVEERGDRIIISGVSASTISRDIKYIWQTSKIAAAMFIKVTWSEVVIPTFFALEFQYILKKMLENKGLYTSKRIIRNIIESLEENTWIAGITQKQEPWLDRSKLNEIIYTLLPHQVAFLNTYENTVKRYNLKGMLLSAAPGGGKSLSSCAVMLTTNCTKVIIVCPKPALHDPWVKTLNKEFKTPQNPYVSTENASLQPDRKWHVFHYESLDRAIELVKTFRNEKVGIIIDESHNFNEIKSMRTTRLLELCTLSRSENIIWASGTPVKALGFETIPLLKSIDPYFDAKAEEAFRKMYGKDAKRTLDILAYRIGLISHTTPKSVVMEDKPIFEEIKVKMPNSDKYTLAELTKVMDKFIEERSLYYAKRKDEYREMYDKYVEIYAKTVSSQADVLAFKEYNQTVAYLIKNGFDARWDGDKAILTNRFEKDKIMPLLSNEQKKEFKDAKSVVKYVDLKIRGECLGRILTKERIQCHVDMLPYIDFKSIINSIKKKTIIFTGYVKVVDAAYEQLTKEGLKPLRIYAETNNEIKSIVERFKTDPNANPMIATFDSLSTAVPLTMANGIIFLNNPWRSYIKEQAVARAHRIGQDQPVYCFDVILDTGNVPNISSRSLDIMQWSKDQVDKIMGITGTAEVSIEQHGFVTKTTADINDVLEDISYERKVELFDYVDQKIKDEVTDKVDYYPDVYNFYNSK